MKILYGISNCDTMKKARTWLDARGIPYSRHDYKKVGIGRAQLERWADALGWEVLLNRAGTTFRNLPEIERLDLDRERAIALMLAQPSAIRRPILEHESGIEVGYKPERYVALFGD